MCELITPCLPKTEGALLTSGNPSTNNMVSFNIQLLLEVHLYYWWNMSVKNICMWTYTRDIPFNNIIKYMKNPQSSTCMKEIVTPVANSSLCPGDLA